MYHVLFVSLTLPSCCLGLTTGSVILLLELDVLWLEMRRCADINYSKHWSTDSFLLRTYVPRYLSQEIEKRCSQTVAWRRMSKNQCSSHHPWVGFIRNMFIFSESTCLLFIYLRRVRQDKWVSKSINDNCCCWMREWRSMIQGTSHMMMWWFFFLLLYWSTLTPPGQKGRLFIFSNKSS